MATPFITNPNDPIIQMVRDCNIILADKGTFPNARILSYLNQHSFPRIRGYLLTARSQTGSEAGRMVFYKDLADLADPSVQANASNLVFQVMTNSIVRDMVYTIAARFAAAQCTTMIAGQIPEQAKIASDLQKEAMADLKQLVQSPELTAAAAAAAQAATSSVLADKSPKIFMACDVNPATFDPVANTIKTFPGAQEAGVANLWVNQYLITTPVAIGDTPNILMNKLLAAVRTYVVSAPPGSQFNLVLGPNEGPKITSARPIEIQDVVGNTQTVVPSFQTNMGWLSFYAGRHDLVVSALFCTLELVNAGGRLGIKGLVYGVMQNLLQLDQPDYNQLSQRGPYSVLIDVTTGNAGTAAVLKPSANIITTTVDSFFFGVTTDDQRTAHDGLLKYRVANIADQSLGVPMRTIKIPRGSDAFAIIRIVADDMASISKQIKVIPALRSATQMQVAGQAVTAPGLRVVPYQLSLSEDKLVFDLLEVPAGVIFGAVPNDLILATPFDNAAKSIVLDIVYHFPTGQVALALIDSTVGPAGTRAVEHKLSSRMSRAMLDINFFDRGIF